jgi:hypothetical protein
VAEKKWSDLTKRQRRVLILMGAAEIVATTAALRDLAVRPDSAVRGPKPAWVLAFLVQPVGPLAYFALGRR